MDYAIYYRPDFYKDTFEKYNVTSEARMEMEEVLKVSNQLIRYLKEPNETLENFQAVVDGREREFFSQREILHMADVKVLFQYGIRLRRICIAILILLLVILLVSKQPFLKTLLHCILGTFLTFLIGLGILTLVIANNFSQSFLLFHKLFFHNDLWLLNPEEDWMIRLLPEGFFMDMAYVIVAIFTISLFAVLAVCVIGLILYVKKAKKRQE